MTSNVQTQIRMRTDGSIDLEAYDLIARRERANAAKSIFHALFRGAR